MSWRRAQYDKPVQAAHSECVKCGIAIPVGDVICLLCQAEDINLIQVWATMGEDNE